MAFGGRAEWQVYDRVGRRKYVTLTERAAILAVADGATPQIRALVYVLAFVGCRVSEALELSPDRLDVDRAAVIIRTLKRRRITFRTVPVPQIVLDLLSTMPSGATGRYWTIHRSTAWRHLRRIMQQAGINGPMACGRGLRHGFCLGAAVRNVPPNLITRWAGHASPATTACYVDAVGHEEREFAARMW